jgi:hypothetical protein
MAAPARPPAELEGRAVELPVARGGGPLVRGALAIDDAADTSAGIAAMLAPGGRTIVHLSIDARDRLDIASPPPRDAADLATRWARFGLAVCAWRAATTDEIATTGSTWARRLRAGADRPGVDRRGADRAVWRLELERPRTAEGGGPFADHR